MSNIREIEGVTRTAKEAAQCKASAFGAGTASPLLNHVYFARAQLLHQTVACSIRALHQQQQILRDSEDIAITAIQLVLLGAGLDTSYDSWGDPSSISSAESSTAYSTGLESSSPTSPVRVFAVDYPTVLQKRTARPGALSGTCCVSADLRDSVAMWSRLQAAGLDFTAPMVIVTEMVCNYLPLESVQALVSALAERRGRAGTTGHGTSKNDNCLWISYDFYTLCTAEDVLGAGFAADMQHHFAARSAPLLHAQSTNCLQYAELRKYDSSCNEVAAHFSKLWPCGYVRPMQAWIDAGKLSQELGGSTSMSMSMMSTQATVQTSDSGFFDEHASLALLHRHFGVSLYGSSHSSFRCLLSLLGVTVRKSVDRAGAGVKGGGKAAELSTIQWSQVREVYKTSFAEYARRHRTVAKFVALSLKHLQPVNPFCAAFACVCVSEGENDSRDLNAPALQPQPQVQVHLLPIPRDSSGSIVGFVALKRTSSAQSNANANANTSNDVGMGYTLELSHMCVEEASRGRGIGSLLLSAVLTYAKQCVPLPQNIVLSVMTELTTAIALYGKAGFCNEGAPVENGTCSLQKMVYLLGS